MEWWGLWHLLMKKLIKSWFCDHWNRSDAKASVVGCSGNVWNASGFWPSAMSVRVDVGQECVQIVCGAANVAANQRVVAALPGLIARWQADWSFSAARVLILWHALFFRMGAASDWLNPSAVSWFLMIRQRLVHHFLGGREARFKKIPFIFILEERWWSRRWWRFRKGWFQPRVQNEEFSSIVNGEKRVDNTALRTSNTATQYSQLKWKVDQLHGPRPLILSWSWKKEPVRPQHGVAKRWRRSLNFSPVISPMFGSSRVKSRTSGAHRGNEFPAKIPML